MRRHFQTLHKTQRRAIIQLERLQHRPQQLQRQMLIDRLVNLLANRGDQVCSQFITKEKLNLRLLQYFALVSFTAASQFPVARLLQAVMESVPANADIHFEINQNAVIDAQAG